MPVTQKMENVLVTPEVAERLLSHNYVLNRNIRETYVNQLANAMKAGRFESQNGQTIVIGGDDGVLYDGQHRLMAVVKSGKSFWFYIVYVDNGAECYKTIDNGTIRVVADYLDIANKTCCAAIAKAMACIELGNAPLLSCISNGRIDPQTPIDRKLIIEYVESHKDLIAKAGRVATKMARSLGYAIVKRNIGIFYAIVTYCARDEYLDEFCDEASNKSTSNKTVEAFKMTAMKAALSPKGKPDTKWQLGLLLDAYSHFCAFDDSTMFNKQAKRLDEYQRLIEQERARRRGEVIL